MLHLEWNDSMLVGVAQFDEHHRHLVELINRSSDTCTEECQADFDTIIEELIDYATYHFAAEEHLMKEHAFPGLELHELEHERFTERVLQFQRDMMNGSGNQSVDPVKLTVFLSNWLTHHILEVDKRYAAYLNRLGIR